MKSKTSLFNKAVFIRNLTGGIGLWLGLIVVYLVMMPLILYFTLNDGQWMLDLQGEKLMALLEHTVIQSMWNQGMFVWLYAVAAIFTAMYLFSYLFTSRNSNMMHTFPVSRMSLFFTNCVSGVIFLTVPQIIASLFSMLVAVSYGAVTVMVIKSWMIWIVVTIVENVFYFSMSVCVLMFVGNILAVPVLYLILNFLYRGCMMIFEAMLETVCYGVVGGVGRIIGVLTPIVYMSRSIGVHIAEDADGYQYFMSGEMALAGYFVVAVLFMVIAWIAYQKKQIETAGDVITVEWLKPIFRWGVAICTSALGALFISSMLYNDNFMVVLASGLMIGIVAFFIAQMLLERSMRVFYAKRIRECIIYVAVMCVCYVGLDADLFGLEKSIPALEEIGGIQMSADSLQLYAVAEDEILWVRDIHAQIINSKKEFEAYSTSSNQYADVYLSYVLKDGSRMRRSYKIPYSTETDSVQGQISAYAKQPDTVLKQFFGVHYPEIEVYGGTIEWYDIDDGTLEDKEIYTSENREVRISEADAKKLYQAIVQDAKEGHFYFDDETAETVSGWGNLILDVRDEQGFLTAYYGISYDYDLGNSKDGSAEIWLNSAYTHLTKELHELGYVSDELYDYLYKNEQR